MPTLQLDFERCLLSLGFQVWMLTCLCQAFVNQRPVALSLVPGLIYHAIASGVIGAVWYRGWLARIAFGMVLLEFGLILVRREWDRTTRI